MIFKFRGKCRKKGERKEEKKRREKVYFPPPQPVQYLLGGGGCKYHFGKGEEEGKKVFFWGNIYP